MFVSSSRGGPGVEHLLLLLLLHLKQVSISGKKIKTELETVMFTSLEKAAEMRMVKRRRPTTITSRHMIRT